MKFELGGIDSLFTKKEYELDMQPLLKLVLGRYFGDGIRSLVDHMVQNFTNSQKSIENYVTKNLIVEDDS